MIGLGFILAGLIQAWKLDSKNMFRGAVLVLVGVSLAIEESQDSFVIILFLCLMTSIYSLAKRHYKDTNC